MRLPLLSLLVGATSIAHAQELPIDTRTGKLTTFNGQPVPPLLEVTPDTFKTELAKSKFLLLKYYNPYCPHCLDYAPNFQTTYEYYFTSKPAAATAQDKTFFEYYDFRFGAVNCLAYGDFCTDLGLTAFPITVLYKNEEVSENIKGVKSVESLSEEIEKALDADKPGSRPAKLQLPEARDKKTPDYDPSAPAAATEGKSNKPSKGAKGSKDSADAASSKSGFGKDWKNPTAAEVHNKKKPKKPSTTPNPTGSSVPLDPESFQRQVTMTTDPWFIKFYAPWCPHCQAVGPTWSQVGSKYKEKLNIGEVNCEREKRLCKDVGVRSFPTFLFFRGGERVEYTGLRGLGDFVEYGDKALEVAGGIPDVDATSLAELEKTEEVVFVYFYDHATATEDFLALERLPLDLIGHAKLVKTNDPKLYDRFKITTWPRLLVSREGKPTYFTPLTPYEMRDHNLVLNWMQSVWLPLVPEVTASNARQIMDGKIVALAVLDREDTESFNGALREMKSAAVEWMERQVTEFQLERKKLRDAKQMRIEEAADRDDERALRAAKTIRINMDNTGKKEATFAWVDGAFWQRWIRTTYGFDVKEGERVIINDQDSRKYWDTTVTGNYILVSRTSVMETLDKVMYNPQALQSKLTISAFEQIFFNIRVAFVEHPYLSFGCVIGLSFGFVSWLRGRTRRARGHFRLDDMGGRELKDGLLGQNGNAKSD